MSTKTEFQYQNESLRKAVPRDASFDSRGAPRAYGRELRCPNCLGVDLKKVSLAYEESVSRITAITRFRGLLFGNDGPDLVFGRSVTKGERKTKLASRIRPPKKWSYGKLFLGAGLVSVVSLILYIHFVMASSEKVSGLPVVVFGVIGTVVLLASVAVMWRHSQWVYPRKYAEWDRSFVCERCGVVSKHDLPGISTR